MKMGPILFIIYFSLVISSFLIFLFGDRGLIAQYKLIDQHKLFMANIDELKSKNKNLEARLDLLKSSPEQIRLLARELGLFYKDEKVLIFQKREPRVFHYEIGQLLTYIPKGGSRNDFLRIGGIFCALLFLGIFLFFNPIGSKQDT